MGFIPLIFFKNSARTIESTIKYFLIQAIGSALIIFSLTAQSNLLSQVNLINLVNPILLTAIILKAGAAPFHWWVPQVAKTSSWVPLSILLTWQKLAPLSLILNPQIILITFFIFLSAILGALGGLIQSHFKTIIAFSSISHLAWILINTLINFFIFLIYFTIYSFITILLIIILSAQKINLISSNIHTNINLTRKLSIIITIFSLGGLPPFPGFFIKILSIKTIWLRHTPILFLIPFLILSSACSLYFYSRINFFLFSMAPTLPKPNRKISKIDTSYFIVLIFTLACLSFPTLNLLIVV